MAKTISDKLKDLVSEEEKDILSSDEDDSFLSNPAAKNFESLYKAPFDKKNFKQNASDKIGQISDDIAYYGRLLNDIEKAIKETPDAPNIAKYNHLALVYYSFRCRTLFDVLESKFRTFHNRYMKVFLGTDDTLEFASSEAFISTYITAFVDCLHEFSSFFTPLLQAFSPDDVPISSLVDRTFTILNISQEDVKEPISDDSATSIMDAIKANYGSPRTSGYIALLQIPLSDQAEKSIQYQLFETVLSKAVVSVRTALDSLAFVDACFLSNPIYTAVASGAITPDLGAPSIYCANSIFSALSTSLTQHILSLSKLSSILIPSISLHHSLSQYFLSIQSDPDFDSLVSSTLHIISDFVYSSPSSPLPIDAVHSITLPDQTLLSSYSIIPPSYFPLITSMIFAHLSISSIPFTAASDPSLAPSLFSPFLSDLSSLHSSFPFLIQYTNLIFDIFHIPSPFPSYSNKSPLPLYIQQTLASFLLVSIPSIPAFAVHTSES